jgi:ribosomal protein L37AE/L43A
MRIKSITSQSRRDFYAIYECEHCGAEHKGGGYDDDNFHRNVIPQMKCPQCGKVASDDFCPMSTKYPEHAIL